MEATGRIELNSIVYDSTFGFGQIIFKSNEECFYNTHESGGGITTPWKRNLGDRLKHYHFYLIDTDAEIKEGSYYFSNQSIRKCIKVNKGLYPYIHLNKKREEIGDFYTWRGNVIALTGVAKNPDNIKVNLPLLSEQSIKLAIDYLNRTGKKEVEVKVDMTKRGDDNFWLEYYKQNETGINNPDNFKYIPKLKLNSEGRVDITIPEEKMYSREQMISFGRFCFNKAHSASDFTVTYEELLNEFEQKL